MPIHAQNGFLGDLTPKWGAASPRRQKAPPCAETRNTRYRSLRSVAQLALLPTPKSYTLTVLFNRPDRHPSELPLRECGSGPLSNTWFLGPDRVKILNGITIGSAVFHGSRSSQIDRPTDHAIPSMCNNGHIYLVAYIVLRCHLKCTEVSLKSYSRLIRLRILKFSQIGTYVNK